MAVSARMLRTHSSANGSGLTLETIVTLLTTGQRATLLLEVSHAYSWERRGGVVLCGVVVNLMDWDCCMNNVGLDSLLVNDWLDRLVDVVMNVLSGDCWGHCLGFGGSVAGGRILELGSFLLKTLGNIMFVAMLVVAVLYSSKVVCMLFWQNLLVMHWLNGGVIMILMNLLVNGGLDVFVFCWSDSLLLNSWCYTLVDGGVMVASLAHEAGNCCLCFIHCDTC